MGSGEILSRVSWGTLLALPGQPFPSGEDAHPITWVVCRPSLDGARGCYLGFAARRDERMAYSRGTPGSRVLPPRSSRSRLRRRPAWGGQYAWGFPEQCRSRSPAPHWVYKLECLRASLLPPTKLLSAVFSSRVHERCSWFVEGIYHAGCLAMAA